MKKQDIVSKIIRKPLLLENLKDEKLVSRVDVREIEFQGNQKTGLHLHPCPVTGYIVEGSAVFEVEGQPKKILKAGDAFFEPANIRILHFDNSSDKPLKFIAVYLLGKEDHDLIKMLE